MLTWLKNLLNREQTSKKEKLFSGLIAFAFIFFVGFRGNIMDEKGSAFYDTLIKPNITPPEWIVPFVWTTLFVLIGLAGYHVWNFYENDRMRKIFTGLYFVNGLLIYLWPYLLFTQQSIGGALYAIIGMIIVAELMILSAFKANHKAAYLLMPYLLWILFATYLNISFLVLNA